MISSAAAASLPIPAPYARTDTISQQPKVHALLPVTSLIVSIAISLRLASIASLDI